MADNQRALSDRFARKGHDRFDGVAWQPGTTGAPLIPGVLAAIECAVYRIVPMGDHDILVGEMVHAEVTEGNPLFVAELLRTGALGHHASIGSGIQAAIDEHLPQPFERTAVNGFGFVQIIRPRARASLVELAQDRAAFDARGLLRRAGFETAGSKRLVAHPAVIAVLQDQTGWLDALARQVGGAVSLRAEASLPISGGYAERA